MFEKFLIDGWYCVAKKMDGRWVVWLKTKSKLEADLFFKRLDPPFSLTSRMTGFYGQASSVSNPLYRDAQAQYNGMINAMVGMARRC